MFYWHIIICILVADAEEETSTSSTVSGEEDSSSVAVTAGLIVLYVFVGYFTILACIVALFCICFVHCNCVCTQCCNSSFCFRLKCSPQILRKQRFKIKCPSSVATKVDTLQTFTAEKCCVCCSDIDTCDSDELAFWTEMVILIILCLPFAICLLALYAYAKSKWHNILVIVVMRFFHFYGFVDIQVCNCCLFGIHEDIKVNIWVCLGVFRWGVHILSHSRSMIWHWLWNFWTKLYYCQGRVLTKASNEMALLCMSFSSWH